MEAAFDRALTTLSGDPILQGLLTILGTFILEDATLITCGLLVADDQMAYATALVALSVGIALGDWGLYVAGRYLGPWIVARRIVSQKRLDRIKSWFDDNMFTAIMVSRFVPGLRLPANIAVGMARASLRRYLPAAFFASWLWTLITLTLIVKLGAAVMPLLGQLKWPVAITLVLVVMYVQRKSYKRMSIDPESATAEEAPASFFEFWHPWLFYAPVALYYFWLAARFRSLTLPTAANPSIYSGGMIRESKSQILGLVPDHLCQWVAPHTAYEFTPEGAIEVHVDGAFTVMAAAGLVLPIVARSEERRVGKECRL